MVTYFWLYGKIINRTENRENSFLSKCLKCWNESKLLLILSSDYFHRKQSKLILSYYSWNINVVKHLIADFISHNRLWILREECLGFLEYFRNIPISFRFFFRFLDYRHWKWFQMEYILLLSSLIAFISHEWVLHDVAY